MFDLNGILPESYPNILIKLTDLMDIPVLVDAIENIDNDSKTIPMMLHLRVGGAYDRMIAYYFDAIRNLQKTDKEIASMFAISLKDVYSMRAGIFEACLKRAIPMLYHDYFQHNRSGCEWSFETSYRRKLIDTNLRNPHALYINSFIRFHRYA
jgi:hypothetical protein